MDCHGTQAAGSFLSRAAQRPIPLCVHWDLTWRCDLACAHCYITDRHRAELSYDECVMILDQLVDAGTLILLFSGGEIFLRPDALDILRAARERTFEVRLTTHGNHIDDAVASALAEIGISRVALSLYSADPAEHDGLTGRPGSHRRTLQAARRLSDRGVRLQLKTPVTLCGRWGWADVGEIADALGADWEIDGNILPDDRGDWSVCSLGLSWEERMLAFMVEIERRNEAVPPLDSLPAASSESRPCSAGITSAFVAPDGDLLPCVNWRETVGNLRSQPFSELWGGSPVLARIRDLRRRDSLKDCEGCSFAGQCALCPGISHRETGDATRRSAWVCERTHRNMSGLERMRDLQQTGKPVPKPGQPTEVLDGPPTPAERCWSNRWSKR